MSALCEPINSDFKGGLVMRIISIVLTVVVSILGVVLYSCSGERGTNPITYPEIVEHTLGEIRIQEMVNEQTAVISDGIDELKICYDHGTSVLSYSCGGFKIEFAPDYIREYTESDELIIRFVDVGFFGRTERYTFNGVEFEIDIRGGEPTAEHLCEFLSYYEQDPLLNTLEGNEDGEKMFALLERAEPLLLQIWQERDAEEYLRFVENGDDLLGRPGWADKVCGAAMLCAATKCFFGGLLNKACLVCVATVSACTIMDMFGWW